MAFDCSTGFELVLQPIGGRSARGLSQSETISGSHRGTSPGTVFSTFIPWFPISFLAEEEAWVMTVVLGFSLSRLVLAGKESCQMVRDHFPFRAVLRLVAGEGVGLVWAMVFS
jgi:hypothetical protein